MKKVDVSENEPDERLGRIAGRLLEALDADPERGQENVVVLLSEPTDNGGRRMSLASGYEEDAEVDAAADVYEHLTALLSAQGVEVVLERRGNVAQLVAGPPPEVSPTGATVTVTITDRKQDGQDAITAVVESKPPLPMIGEEPAWDSLTPAQIAAVWSLMEVGSKTADFQWRTVFKRDD